MPLVTFDLEFGDVRLYPPGASPGVRLLRLADQQPDAGLDVLGRFGQITASISRAALLS
ncbi:MAG: hypothetical protein ACRD0K_30315 [Egibacteraceae bacterium]